MNDLLSCVIKNDIKEAARLLKTGFDPNTKDSDGRTALMYAAIDGKDEFVNLLVSCKSNINAQDNQGFSSLHFAAQNYHSNTVKALLQAGAEVDIKDKFGNTPLWRAVFNSRGRGEIILLLLEHGADRLLKNKSGKTPLELANIIGNYNVKQFFN